MVQTRSRRRPTLLLALGMVTVGGLMLASPAAAQGRFRVLVPKSIERQDNANKGFGEKVSNELKKLINTLQTHAPVEKKELSDALKQYKLKDDDLANCITARQLAAQRGFELVLCGTYVEKAGGFEVNAKFVSPREGQEFSVPAFTASDDKQAAQQIFDSFRSYVDLLRFTQFCNDHLASQQWSEALDRCDSALAIDGDAERALYGRGYALMQLEQNEPAMAALTKVLEVNPIHQEALMAAGFLAAKMGRMEESRNYYREYLELNPGNAQVRLTIATDAAKAGDNEGALQLAEQGLQGEEIDLTLAEYAGYFAVAAAADVEQAEGEANGEVPPRARGFYEKALGYFSTVYETKADSVQPNLLVSYVNALNKLDRTAEALELGGQFVRVQPDHVPLWNSYAAALRDAGRIDEALAALDSVLAKDPEAQMVRARKAQWLLQAGHFDRARQAYRVAVDAEEITGEQAARAFLAIGVNDKYQQKDYDGALPYLTASLDYATEPATQGMAHYFLGYIFYTQGDEIQKPSTAASAQKALPVFQKALDHVRKAKPYADTNPSAARSMEQLVGAITQFIEIQEALIKRGR